MRRGRSHSPQAPSPAASASVVMPTTVSTPSTLGSRQPPGQWCLAGGVAEPPRKRAAELLGALADWMSCMDGLVERDRPFLGLSDMHEPELDRIAGSDAIPKVFLSLAAGRTSISPTPNGRAASRSPGRSSMRGRLPARVPAGAHPPTARPRGLVARARGLGGGNAQISSRARLSAT